MIVDFTKDYKYSLNGFTVISSCAGDNGVDLPDDMALNLIGKGVCVQKKDSPKKDFSPVEETAVIEPVEEVKTKRRAKRGKK
jgi:hypothetical protein